MNQELNSIEEETPETGANLQELAGRLKELDGQISGLNHEIANLKSEREMVSDEIVSELSKLGPEIKGLSVDGVGVIKLESKAYPKVLDMASFIRWAKENCQTMPSMSFNASTLAAWFQEQMDNNLPLPPEDILAAFWKTRAKVNKR